jgi:hypothetical protein
MKKEKSTNLRLKRSEKERKALLILTNKDKELQLVHSLDYYSLKTLKGIVEKRLEELSENHFRINEHLSLKLEGKATNIYVDGEKFKQCKYLLLDIPEKEIKNTNKYRTIDEMKDIYSRDHEYDKDIIKPEMEFIGHCSNLQAWYEHDYDTTILHSNLALPLLHKLYQAGEPKAKRVFKEQLVNRLKLGEPKVTYTIIDKYLQNFSSEELEAILYDIESDFIQLMIKLLCIKENEFGIPPKNIAYTRGGINIDDGMIMIRPKESMVEGAGDVMSAPEDRSILDDCPEIYETLPLFSLRQEFIELPHTKSSLIPLDDPENYTFATLLIQGTHLSIVEALFGDPAKVTVLFLKSLLKGEKSSSLNEGEKSLHFHSNLKDIAISMRSLCFGGLLAKTNTNAFKKGIKQVPTILPRFMQLAFMFKLLDFTVKIHHKYKFRVENPAKPHPLAINLTISKYGYIHRSKSRYESHKSIPFQKFKKRIKPRLNNNLIEFGIKGIKGWPDRSLESKEDVKPEKIGTCFYRYTEFKKALKCFKDKSSIEVRYPSGILAKNYCLNLRSKKEDIEVELFVNKII